MLARAELLAAADLLSRRLNDPANMPINAVILAVAVITGAIAGRHRRRLAVAATSAVERTEELRAASAEAVQAERRQIARELHDLVSPSVSLVAMQAGSAEMLWPTDQAAAREALGDHRVHDRTDRDRTRAASAGPAAGSTHHGRRAGIVLGKPSPAGNSDPARRSRP